VSLPELYLSLPGVSLPEAVVDNAEILRRVRERHRGPEGEWSKLEAAIAHMFGLCNTQVRHLETDPDARVADYAVAAARDCLAANDASLDEVDLVICGGIARQYFEPATAMEVAAKLGLSGIHAFDVTTACVGHLEALQTAAAYLTLHPEYRCALVCTAELSGGYLSYDIQRVRDLSRKFAGLTIGNGAACMLLRRSPWPHGGVRLLRLDSHVVPAHWDLCQVPIDGTLVSSSVELMRLRKLIPPLLHELLGRVGWTPAEVDHYVLHQPSESEIRQVLSAAGADPERGIYTHHRYGNTASASVGLAYRDLARERALQPGDKLVLGSAAAGFSVVVGTGTWVGPQGAAR